MKSLVKTEAEVVDVYVYITDPPRAARLPPVGVYVYTETDVHK